MKRLLLPLLFSCVGSPDSSNTTSVGDTVPHSPDAFQELPLVESDDAFNGVVCSCDSAYVEYFMMATSMVMSTWLYHDSLRTVLDIQPNTRTFHSHHGLSANRILCDADSTLLSERMRSSRSVEVRSEGEFEYEIDGLHITLWGSKSRVRKLEVLIPEAREYRRPQLKRFVTELDSLLRVHQANVPVR